MAKGKMARAKVQQMAKATTIQQQMARAKVQQMAAPVKLRQNLQQVAETMVNLQHFLQLSINVEMLARALAPLLARELAPLLARELAATANVAEAAGAGPGQESSTSTAPAEVLPPPGLPTEFFNLSGQSTNQESLASGTGSEASVRESTSASRDDGWVSWN